MEEEHISEGEGRMSDDETASNRSTPAKSATPRPIGPIWGAGTGRGITLGMLMQDDIIKAGEGVLTINYLGKKFIGDLLNDGRIKWQETKEIFSSPSAWAIHCKKLVNPAKKSGCGWASVKYKGLKLDVYKSSWFRKHNQDRNQYRRPSTSAKSDSHTDNDHEENGDEESRMDDEDDEEDAGEKKLLNNSGEALDLSMSGPNRDNRVKCMPFTDLGKRGPKDPNALVQCATFNQLGRRQPYTITVASNCLMMVDFHSHLTTSEVVGYLAGKWDEANTHLIVQQAMPCRARLADKENSLIIEEEIRQNMERRGLSLVGWYHSHSNEPQPSVRDIESQYEYQLCLRGFSDLYHPCIGLIVNPYPKAGGIDSKVQIFCIVPPLEVSTYDYCLPVEMQYTEIQDAYLLPDVIHEMKFLVDFCRGAPDLVKYGKIWEGKMTYLDKLKACLSKRVPRDQIEAGFIHTIQILVQQYL